MIRTPQTGSLFLNIYKLLLTLFMCLILSQLLTFCADVRRRLQQFNICSLCSTGQENVIFSSASCDCILMNHSLCQALGWWRRGKKRASTPKAAGVQRSAKRNSIWAVVDLQQRDRRSRYSCHGRRVALPRNWWELKRTSKKSKLCTLIVKA